MFFPKLSEIFTHGLPLASDSLMTIFNGSDFTPVLKDLKSLVKLVPIPNMDFNPKESAVLLYCTHLSTFKESLKQMTFSKSAKPKDFREFLVKRFQEIISTKRIGQSQPGVLFTKRLNPVLHGVQIGMWVVLCDGSNTHEPFVSDGTYRSEVELMGQMDVRSTKKQWRVLC
ncbi:hypothetical protein WICPIJ_007935 [Wickerhamomyces pijperi]|uniref:Uncharacterized protein n=1 Tax=Wickerhamomyces pijperi TaxID=599730 RepID=A0A9P8PZ07_WICPI|nr:hypothetical protein WICPIJ_007935 [Wickerhamomyces pijperi]